MTRKLLMKVQRSEVSIRSVEEYWDSRPCNIRHSNQELGTREYFDEVERKKYFVEPHIPDFAKFGYWKSKSVLEVGCGIGTDAVNFARAGARYTGIDVSEASLNLARQRFEVFGLSGRFIHANVEELTNHLRGETFDLIYSFGVLHHTPNIIAGLKELRLLCSEHSELRIMVYASRSWKAALIDAGLEQPEAQAGCPIANTYSPDEVRLLLADSGFAVTSISQDHIFPYEIEPYKQHRYTKVPHFACMDQDFFSKLEKTLGWHLLVTAIPIG